MTIIQIQSMVNSSPTHIHGKTIFHKAMTSGCIAQIDGSEAVNVKTPDQVYTEARKSNQGIEVYVSCYDAKVLPVK